MVLDKLTGRVEGYREYAAGAGAASDLATASVKKIQQASLKAMAKQVAKGIAADAKRVAMVVKKNPKMVAAAVAASGIVGYGIYQATKVEETPLTITGIMAYTAGGSKTEYTISYTPPIGILQTDGVSITGSKTVPSIDGSPSEIIKIIGPSSFVLDLGELTSMSPGGTINITSSFLAQAGSTTGEAAGATVQGAAAAVAPAAAGISEGFLGLGPYAIYIGGAGALCSSLCCMLLIVFILKQANH